LLLTLGIFSIALLLMILGAIAYCVIRKFFKYSNPLQKVADKIKKELMFSAPLRYLIASNIKITHQAFFYLFLLRNDPELSSFLATI
jgi:hypothetical protein